MNGAEFAMEAPIQSHGTRKFWNAWWVLPLMASLTYSSLSLLLQAQTVSPRVVESTIR